MIKIFFHLEINFRQLSPHQIHHYSCIPLRQNHSQLLIKFLWTTNVPRLLRLPEIMPHFFRTTSTSGSLATLESVFPSLFTWLVPAWAYNIHGVSKKFNSRFRVIFRCLEATDQKSLEGWPSLKLNFTYWCIFLSQVFSD